mgnify:CR=1 FL=1
MNILAIDTATEACSAALHTSSIDAHLFEVCPQQHSQKILPMIDELLTSHSLSLQQIELLAFGRGPGSFTGVRIATGIIQGLSYGTGLKVAAISTLQTMAQEVFSRTAADNVSVMIDARMQEVYYCHYRNEQGLAVATMDEGVADPEVASEALANARASFKQPFYAGTGWQAYQLVYDNNALPVTLPNAQYMTALASKLHQQGDLVDAHEVTPSYVRDTVTWKKLPGR